MGPNPRPVGVNPRPAGIVPVVFLILGHVCLRQFGVGDESLEFPFVDSESERPGVVVFLAVAVA